MSYYKNPENGHVEEITNDASWLGFVFFGLFYFLYKGAWRAALLSFFGYPIAVSVGAFVGAAFDSGPIPIILWPLGLLALISFTVYSEVERVYRMKGWTKVDSKGNEIKGKPEKKKNRFWSVDPVPPRDD